MRKKWQLMVLLWLIAFASLYAGSENEGKTGLAFLKIGVGARASGMGEAYTAVSDDAFSTYWNPAGLLAGNQSNLVFMHNEWLLDVNGEFGAVLFRGKKSGIALHGYSVNIGGIDVRTAPTSQPLETTSAHYLSFGLSYARHIRPGLDMGITVKYLFEKIFIHTASGYGMDLGLRYRGFLPNLTIAAVMQNLGSMNDFREDATRLPKIVRLGAAYQFPRTFGSVNLLLASDIVKPLEENTRFHIGAEGVLWSQLSLRMGYAVGYENRNVSFGLGIRKSAFRFDYSYTPFDNNLGNGQRFSLYISL